MRKDGKLTIEEVAVLVGVSVQTINIWYRFKKYEPEHELAKALPKFTRDDLGGKQTRYWNRDDIGKLIQFKNKLPQGRGGVMGAITQRYYHKKKEIENE